MERVDRRRFLLIAAGSALTARPARAVRRIPRIGILGPGSRYDEGRGSLASLRAGLEQLGWVDGRDIVLLDRWAEGRLTELPALAAELTAGNVDLLVAGGTPATLAARNANASLPIVMVGAEYAAGRLLGGTILADSNLTGLSLNSSALTRERLCILQRLVHGLDRIVVILRDEPGLELALGDIRDNARQLGLRVNELIVTSGKSIERAFQWMRADGTRALYFASGPLGPAKHTQVIELAAAARIPTVYPLRAFAADGGFVSVAADNKELFYRAAGFVDKLLNGLKPTGLPVIEPMTFELVINLTTARAIGVSIPEGLLARANGVIDQTHGS